MALISTLFNCFGLSSNSSSQVSDYDEKLSQTKSLNSEKPKSKEKSMGAPVVVISPLTITIPHSCNH